MTMVSDTDTTTIFPKGDNSTIFPDTGDNSTVTLEDLNDAEIQLLIPTIVYLAVLSVVGMLGNSLVCKVYRTRYHLSNSQCFILCLSVIDLFSCTVNIPLEVAIVISQYNFKHLWLCKLSRFLNVLSTLSASFVLYIIVIDRYRKVCRPGAWQIKAKIAKYLCGFSVIFGLVFSWPALCIYVKQRFDIPKYGLTGTKCSTEETIYPKIHVAAFGGWLVVGAISGLIMYCLIVREAYIHTKRMPKESVNPKQSLAQKTTFVLILISAAFVVSYGPIVLLLIMRQSRDNYEETLTDGERAVYKFFLRSYFFNSAINPVIYGFCDYRFRAACKETFSRCWPARESRDVDQPMTTLSSTLSQTQSD